MRYGFFLLIWSSVVLGQYDIAPTPSWVDPQTPPVVFEIPEEPEQRYQLVHDYLVRYVRDVQTQGLMAELEEARAQIHTISSGKRKASQG